MQDWEAALVGYIGALIMAQTEAAPIAVVGAWGIAVFLLLDQIGGGGKTLSSLVSSIGGAASGQASSPPIGSTLATTPPSQVSGSGGGFAPAMPGSRPTISPG